MERSVYVYRDENGFEPVVLHLRDDGSCREERTTCPSGDEATERLQLIGHLYEADEVCFNDTDSSELCVWSVSGRREVQRVPYADDDGAPLFGFSRTADGLLKIVCVWRPNIVEGSVPILFQERSRMYHGGAWTDPIVTHNRWPFTPFVDQVARFVDGHLYWTGKVNRDVRLLDYNVETDTRRYLPPPVLGQMEDARLHEDLVLGHGLEGELSASILAPPAFGSPYGQLRIWSLRRGVWEKVRYLNPSSLPRERRAFVPIFFFQGRIDGLLNFVLLKDGEHILMTSNSGGGNHRSTSLFSRRLHRPPPLLPCTVGRAEYRFTQPTNTEHKSAKRRREPEPDTEDQRRKKVIEATQEALRLNVYKTMSSKFR